MSALVDAEARERIRTDLGTSLFVEAAAGTGKTTELTRRIVAVLAAGLAPVEAIVAVTFTEKAAGELKLRLRAALELARRAAEPGSFAQRNLVDALSRLEEARIDTIHGFCGDLLRERPIEAAIDPEFRTLTEPESRRIHAEVFDLWLQQTLADPPEGVRRSLRRPPRPSDTQGAVGRLRDASWELAGWRDLAAPWTLPAGFERTSRIDALVAELHEVAALTARCARPADNGLFDDTAILRRVSGEIATAERARARDHDGLEGQLDHLARRSRDWMKRKGRGRDWCPGVPLEDVRAAREAFQGRLADFMRVADADLAARLHAEVAEVARLYDEAKERAGALDFLDLLVRARDLVRNDAAVRADLQRRIGRIFVDEFQDTDPLQAELILLLAADDPAESDHRNVTPAPGKLFLVGDPKQSIYRFRRADVGTYEDVRALLASRGVAELELATSYRAVPAIQNVVNAAFGPAMTGEGDVKSTYVPLAPARLDRAGQPAVVVLPVPEPYGFRGVSGRAIEASLPDATGAFLGWLLNESGWTVTERGGEEPVPVAARHVALLFRRFESWGRDVTRAYADALDARGIPHLIVGGKAYHGREEVETLRTALAAIEWPEDELSVYATLRGPLFSIEDDHLLEYKAAYGRIHPFRPAEPAPPERLRHVADALAALRELSRGRNRRPIAETIARLLSAVRAHAALVLRANGEQVLANVLYLSELAREYEAQGGLSFRGFVDRLAESAEEGDAPEAPILEEGSEGVRLMTVHKAKGLEFPVVVLADISARLSRDDVSRHVDGAKQLCALKLAGLAPLDLLEHEDEERRRDAAEGIRVAYVAATRARDLLVVPAVGDAPWEEGWVSPLCAAIYPSPVDSLPAENPADGCPLFGTESVLARSDDLAGQSGGVHPGLHRFGDPAFPGSYGVVWWDPSRLALRVAAPPPVRYPELVTDESVPPERIANDRAAYDAWSDERARTIAEGARATHDVRVVTSHRAAADIETFGVELVELPIDDARPKGRRFGSLVHAVLGTVPLGGSDGDVLAMALFQGRVLGATAAEMDAAGRTALAALRSPLLARARGAEARRECRREVPLVFPDGGAMVEGVVDLAFREGGCWTVVDFKTDHEIASGLEAYRRQVALYARAIADATGEEARAVLLRV